jgi:hypothetical protein
MIQPSERGKDLTTIRRWEAKTAKMPVGFDAAKPAIVPLLVIPEVG